MLRIVSAAMIANALSLGGGSSPSPHGATCRVHSAGPGVPGLTPVAEVMDFVERGAAPHTDALPHTQALRREAVQLGLALRGSDLSECPVGVPDEWCREAHEMSFPVDGFSTRIHSTMEQARSEITAPVSADYPDHALAGNKHRNLILMSRLADAVQIPRLHVPVPRAIDSPKVMAFLKEHAPEVFQEWQHLGELFKSRASLPEMSEELKAIQHQIERAFASHPFPFSPAFKSWLGELKKSSSYLMVRSSGAEDSKVLANAGGNVSPNYIEPSEEAVGRAIGQVIAS